MMEKVGILLVSFGTTVSGAHQLTVKMIKDKIAKEYPACMVCEAWTSKWIIKRIYETTGKRINTVAEALKEMIQLGIREVYIQPTYIINGIENTVMKEAAEMYRGQLKNLVFGDPLLTSPKDFDEIVRFVQRRYADVKEDEAVILMGHGSKHASNEAYQQLDKMLRVDKRQKIYLCTMGAECVLKALLQEFRKWNIRKVYLVPFLFTAARHAIEDMAGEKETSWKSICQKAGYEVECSMKGLGEYPEVQKMIVQHLKDIIE